MSTLPFEQLRAEPEVRAILQHVRRDIGDKSYEVAMEAIYGGWMDDSVLSSGLLFSYLMKEAGAPAPLFTNPILELVFSVARGNDDDYDSEEDWRRERHALVEEFLAWINEFLAWGKECFGVEPWFDWDRFTTALKRNGVISPSSMLHLDIFAGVRRGVSSINAAKWLSNANLLQDSILELLLRNNLLGDYRRFLAAVDAAVQADVEPRFIFRGGDRAHLSPFLGLSPEDKATLLPLVRLLYGRLSDNYSGGLAVYYGEPSTKEKQEVAIALVLEHGGAFTPENLLTFATLLEEYNWEWAVAAMEWKRGS